ncbi:MAG: rhomboid family intramembrane serine protease [Bacteroidales bacterium]|nr:rhomboid family intramembrane serine protease [Bacteroidales bacterium]
MNKEFIKILISLQFPVLFILLLWVIKGYEALTGHDLGFLGVYPRRPGGLWGILTSPLIHGDFRHLFANSVPLFVLGGCLFYFYREIAAKSFLIIYLVTGLWVWVGARSSIHIGASGVVYGLASFLFVSGILRKDGRLLAITLLVTFLYGSLVWGIFPDFLQKQNISWESHLWGLVAGFITAVYFRKEGPQKKVYEWELEEEDEDQNSYPADPGAENKTDPPFTENH